MDKKKSSAKPAKTQEAPGHPGYRLCGGVLIPIPEVMRTRAKAAYRVFQTACAMETLGNMLEEVGDLDDGDTTGAGCLQHILGESLMEAYGELSFLEEDHKPAAAGGQR